MSDQGAILPWPHAGCGPSLVLASLSYRGPRLECVIAAVEMQRPTWGLERMA